MCINNVLALSFFNILVMILYLGCLLCVCVCSVCPQGGVVDPLFVLTGLLSTQHQLSCHIVFVNTRGNLSGPDLEFICLLRFSNHVYLIVFRSPRLPILMSTSLSFVLILRSPLFSGMAHSLFFTVVNIFLNKLLVH